MVPDKFNMVDMGGIDLIMMQGEAVPGLYDKLMAAISNCQYQCLYNWIFDGVLIPPAYVQLEVVDNEIFINEGVSVTSDDVIHIYSVEPGPVEPEIIPLLAEENGVYNVPAGKDGFNPVTVDVPSYTPVIEALSVTENGTYPAPSGVDGYSPVTVNVSGVVPINILHPKSYSGSAYNSPDPNVSISRSSDDAATVTFNGTKTTNDTINYQLQIPNDVIQTFVGCKVRAVSNDSRVAMHIQKRTSPWTYYGGTSPGSFMTIPSISESDIVFCVDIKEAGEYNNVTSYLEVFGIE